MIDNVNKDYQKLYSINIVRDFEKWANNDSNILINNSPYQNQLLLGEKRVIYPILYFLLTRLEEHQQRAYLSKYLVPFTLPEDIPFDEEMKGINDKYKDL